MNRLLIARSRRIEVRKSSQISSLMHPKKEYHLKILHVVLHRVGDLPRRKHFVRGCLNFTEGDGE